MTGPFETGSSSIDLDGPPWNVTEMQKIYILNPDDGDPTVYTDPQHMMLFEPAEFRIAAKTSTGIYVYLTEDSAPGTTFPNDPVMWTTQGGNPPPSITYGKIRSDSKAFSMKDYHENTVEVEFHFTITVQNPNGTISRVVVDPTIVEEPEIPPDG